jgi:hypothetical protein
VAALPEAASRAFSPVWFDSAAITNRFSENYCRKKSQFSVGKAAERAIKIVGKMVKKSGATNLTIFDSYPFYGTKPSHR